MKTLTVKFTFAIQADEFGLYSLPEAARKWIKDQRGDCLIADLAVMEVLPIEDAPSPGGLVAVRKRTRGPGRKNAANGATGEASGTDAAPSMQDQLQALANRPTQ
jgi:hypothetical protein